MKLSELESAVETILFASGEAVTLNRIAMAISQDINTTKNIIRGLIDKLSSEKRGIEIVEVDDSFQMRTNPLNYEYVKILHDNPEKKVLTQALLETLAIIAYKQPITKAMIEEIRGVDATHGVNKLVEYGLVTEKGRMDSPGKPILFGTTSDFLKFYGFSSLETLPEISLDDDQLRLEAEQEADKILD